MIAKYAIALIVVIVLAAAFAWAFLPARYLPGNRARHLRIRLHLRLHPGKGFAHLFSLWLRWGRLAALRRSGRIRALLPLWYRIAEPHQHSVFLGRAHYRHGLRVPLEEHLLVMAPPRTHKTAFLADVILRYPGPVIATSTKPDLYALTAAVRAQHGRVHVFNPQHIGGVASTFCWDPVAGCEDPATAIRRADAFAFAVSQKGVEDGTFWSAKASDYLRGYFCAAALARYDLRAVAAWVAGAEPGRPRADPARRRRPPVGPHPGRTPLRSPQDRRHRADGHVKIAGLHGRPGPGRQRAARSRRRVRHPRLPRGHRHGVPDRRGRLRRGSRRPAVRRDGHRDPLGRRPARPGLTVRPTGSAAFDGPGRGDPDLPGTAAVLAIRLRRQRHPSLRRRARRGAAGRPLGDYGRQVVLDTSSVKVFLPGITDTTTLQAASTLCGQASWKVRGQDHATRHDVATPDMIRQLPAGFALVIRGGCAPVIARLPRAWKNPAYRRARRLGQAPAELAEAEWPEPDLPDYVPAEWLRGDGTTFPWS